MLSFQGVLNEKNFFSLLDIFYLFIANILAAKC